MQTLTQPASDINILIVDDLPDNLRLLAKILESQDYTVMKSLSGKMALQSVHHSSLDLILLDINMPEMNGFEVCQQLRASARTVDIPVIFISALDQITDKVQAFELGAQDYITKPFQELEVLARVKNQLLIQQQRRLLLQQNQQLQQEIQERQQAEAKVRQMNVELERRVQARTLELQQALNFELALKRITDQVRDSLDPHQILQTAVETLAQALEVGCCDAALYSVDQVTSTLRYQWTHAGSSVTQGQLLKMAEHPELYQQLQERKYFAFCHTDLSPSQHHFAILACPVFDDRVDETGTLGDLWLFRATYSSFSEMEIHLVQQVANQCAIALRQARLYEASQAQVHELERLNHLKDDFLSTISHELRTPLASMKMALKLLTTVTDQGRNLMAELAKSPQFDPDPNSKVARYLNLLQEECDRELALVEDLLNLQYIEAGNELDQPIPIDLPEWIPHLIEPFEFRTQNQQQTLHVDLEPDLPIISLDRVGLNRVVTELLTNACKYTPLGGEISLAIRLIPAASPTESPRCLQLTVTNTGIEISPEELPRIFDKFYRIPNHDPWKNGGTGLGLTLVKRLVERMGGAIAVESAQHITRFTVRWPLD